LAGLRIASAKPFYAVPSQFGADPRPADSVPFSSELFRNGSVLGCSQPLHIRAVRIISYAHLCFSGLRHRLADPYHAKANHCLAVPPRFNSIQLRSLASSFFALPKPNISSLLFAGAGLFNAYALR